MASSPFDFEFSRRIRLRGTRALIAVILLATVGFAVWWWLAKN